MPRQRVARNVNAVKLAKILAAILQVVVDLQRRAHRIRGRPHSCALAMDVEHEPSDWHRRVRAVMNELVPVLVAKLCHVHPERDQQAPRMARRKAARGERLAQNYRLALRLCLTEQAGIKLVEEFK